MKRGWSIARFACLFSMALSVIVCEANDPHLARAIKSGKVHRIDRHMKRLIHREGKDFRAPGSLHAQGGAEARIAHVHGVLRGQIGVVQVDHDRCAIKPAIWPGTWTLGVVYRTREASQMLERCYVIQGGRLGTVDLFGWRPRVRKARNDLRVVSMRSCPGFLAEQERICDRMEQR